MTDFETSGSVVIEIDQGSLREARRDVEEEIGSVTVQARGDRGGGMGRSRTDGGVSSMGLAGGGGLLEELNNQTDVLEDIHDEIQKAGVSGAGGGGGGGGGGGDGGTASRAVDMVSGAGLSRLLLGGGLGGGLAMGGAGSVLAGGIAGYGVGLGGVAALEKSGAIDATQDFGKGAREVVGGGTADRALRWTNIGTRGQLGDMAELGTTVTDQVEALLGRDTGGNEQERVRDTFSGDLFPSVDVSEGGRTDPSGPYDLRPQENDEPEREIDRSMTAEDHAREDLGRYGAAYGSEETEAVRQRQNRQDLGRYGAAYGTDGSSELNQQSDRRLQQLADDAPDYSGPPKPGSQTAEGQVTNDVTIELGSMQELHHEIERMIEEALRQFGQDFAGGGGPGYP